MKRMFFLAAISLLSAAGASAQRIVMAEFQTASTGKQYAVILDAGWFDGILYYDYDIEAESNVLFDAVGVHVDMENLRKFRNAAGRLTAEYMKCINEANASGEETFSKDLKLRFPPVNLDVIFEGV